MQLNWRMFARAALIAAFVFCGWAVFAQSAQPMDSETDMPVVPAREAGRLGYVEAAVLGLVEGITEYLPISSTGHLILTNRFLNLDVAQPMSNADGLPILIEGDDGPEPFTLKHAADGYAIIIQGGAILAVAILYWSRLTSAFSGGFGLGFLILSAFIKPISGVASRFKSENIALARNLIVAFLPAAVLGLLLDDLIESYLFGPWPVVSALVAGAFLMLAVEHNRRRSHLMHAQEGPDLHEMSIRQALMIGFLQCVAMWPGTSRSMMTIVGGYIAGLNPVRAAEFSFLLGFITLTAASLYKSVKVGVPMLEAVAIGPILMGIFVATIAAALAVKWLVAYLTKHGLALFAWYRIALAVVVVILII